MKKKIFNIIIIYIINCCILQGYLRINSQKSNFTHIEDIYHNKSVNNLFYGIFTFPELSYNDINTIINKLNELDKNIKNEKNSEYLIRYNYTDEWKNINKKVQIIFFKNVNKVVVTFNHTYIGGYHILQYLKIATDSDISDVPKMLKIPGIAEYYALKCLVKRPDKCKNNFKFNINNNIKFFYKNIPILNKPDNIKTNIWTIKHILDNVVACYPKINRKFRILIPLAFKPEKGIYNNVSAVILEYDQNGMEYKEIENSLSKLKYQVIGGNYLSNLNFEKLFNKIKFDATEVRNNIDIILSLTHVKKEKKSLDLFVYTNKKSIESLYILAVGSSNSIKVSYSVYTDDFDYNKLNAKEITNESIEKDLGKI